MGFLIRMAFWFSLVLLMLPFGGDGSEVGPIRAFLAAREAVDDLSGICLRKPDVCETGKAALHTIGVRAQASARLAYDMLDEEGRPVGPPATAAEAEPAAALAAAPDTAELPDMAITTGAVPTPRPADAR